MGMEDVLHLPSFRINVFDKFTVDYSIPERLLEVGRMWKEKAFKHVVFIASVDLSVVENDIWARKNGARDMCPVVGR